MQLRFRHDEGPAGAASGDVDRLARFVTAADIPVNGGMTVT